MVNHNSYFVPIEMKLIIEECGKVLFCTFFSHSYIALHLFEWISPFWAEFFGSFWKGIKNLWDENETSLLEWQLIWIFIPEKNQWPSSLFSSLITLYITEFTLFNYGEWRIECGWILYHLHFLYIFLLILNKKRKILPLSVVYKKEKGFHEWRYSLIHNSGRTHRKHQTFVIFLFLFQKKFIQFSSF